MALDGQGQPPQQPKIERMEEAELLAYLHQCENASVVFGATELASAQADAMDRFYGRDYGTEENGRSQAHTYEVRELIGWALPLLKRIFQASDDLVTINSGSEQLIPQTVAKQMADGLNHIFWDENEGSALIHDWLFDGLLQRIGCMEVRREPPKKLPPEEFEAINALGIQNLLGRGYQILGAERLPPQQMLPAPGAQGLPGVPGNPTQMQNPLDQRFNVKAQRTLGARIVCESFAPEEFSWEGTAPNLEAARYHARRKRVFLRDVQQAYPEKALELEGASSGNFQIGDAQARWLARHQNTSGADQIVDSDGRYARRELLCHEFVRIDYDGDGIIELREVIRVSNVILYNEAAEGTCFHTWTPLKVPHTVAGLSLADEAIEVQGINTSLTRRGLDSLAMALNQRVAYDSSKVAEEEVDALIDNRIGSVIPTKGPPSSALFPIATPDVSEMALTWKGHFSQSIETRTGIGPQSNGVDPQMLARNQSGTAMNLSQTAASGRLEDIARAAADGLEKVFQTILRLVVQYQDDKRVVQPAGKPPLIINPAEWSPDASVSIHVAIAAASRPAQMAHLSMITAKQESILLKLGPNNPLVTLDQYSNALAMLVEAAGFRAPERFFNLIPKGQVPQVNTPPDPKIAAAQQSAQVDQMTAQAAQVRLDEAQRAEIARKMWQTQQELQLKAQQVAEELALKRVVIIEELNLKREVAGLQRKDDFDVPNSPVSVPVSPIEPGGLPG
jgi:hypothetical protein